MVRVQNRISIGLGVLEYFTLREWNFGTSKADALLEKSSPEDLKIFNLEKCSVDFDEYMLNGILGGRQYCLKEPLSSIPKARVHLKM